MTRAQGIRPQFQGVQEPVQPGRIARPRVVPIGSSTDAAEAVRGILSGLTSGVRTLVRDQERRYDELVTTEAEKAVSAVVTGQEIPELHTDEALEAGQRAQGAREAMLFNPADVTVKEGQTPHDAFLAHLDQEYGGLPMPARVTIALHALPPFARYIQQQQAAQDAQILDNEAAGLSASLGNPNVPVDETTPSYRAYVKRARAAGLTDEDIIGQTLLPAARAAAATGQTERVDEITALTDGRMPSRFEQARAAAEATVQQQASDDWAQRVTDVRDPITGMDPVIEGIKQDDRLKGRAKAQSLARAHGRRDMAVSQGRKELETTLIQGARYGTLPLEDVVRKTDAHGALPFDHPLHLPPPAVNRVMAVAEERLAFDGRREHVAGRLRGEEGYGPLSPKHDPALLETMATAGIVEITSTGDGRRYAFTKVLQPIPWAAAVDRGRRNPAEITTAIQTGIASSDAGDVATGLHLYATLYATSPDMAEPMLDGMSDLARLRTAYVMSKLTTPVGDQQALRDEINGHMVRAMRLDPKVEITPAQADGVLYGGDPTITYEDRKRMALAQVEIKKRLPERLQDELKRRNIPAFAVNTFTRLARKNYLINRAKGTASPQADAELALTDAARQTFQLHPAIVWDGETYFVPSGTGLPPGDYPWGKWILEGLRSPVVGLDADEVEEVVGSHWPTWDRSNQRWVLTNIDGEEFSLPDGRIFTWDPSLPDDDGEPEEPEDPEALRRRLELKATGQTQTTTHHPGGGFGVEGEWREPEPEPDPFLDNPNLGAGL